MMGNYPNVFFVINKTVEEPCGVELSHTAKQARGAKWNSKEQIRLSVTFVTQKSMLQEKQGTIEATNTANGTENHGPQINGSDHDSERERANRGALDHENGNM